MRDQSTRYGTASITFERDIYVSDHFDLLHTKHFILNTGRALNRSPLRYPRVGRDLTGDSAAEGQLLPAELVENGVDHCLPTQLVHSHPTCQRQIAIAREDVFEDVSISQSFWRE